MQNALERFAKELTEDWLPSFCNARASDFLPEGFDTKTLERVSEYDAHWFLRAIDTGMIVEKGGFFKSTVGKTNEQIFWSGRKINDGVRKTTIWVEPIIAIATWARTVQELGWPPSQVGTQSKHPWPFDLICYGEDSTTEIVACEIKKSDREIEKLVSQMRFYGEQDPLPVEPEKGVARNSYRKVVGIRECWAPVFWAVGPAGNSKLFEIVRVGVTQRFEMRPASTDVLNFSTHRTA